MGVSGKAGPSAAPPLDISLGLRKWMLSLRKPDLASAPSSIKIAARRLGLELELKAIDFFKSCASKTGDPEVKEIFLKISEEERFHYDLLQAQVDSLTNTGFWLDSSEFHMDGKF